MRRGKEVYGEILNLSPSPLSSLCAPPPFSSSLLPLPLLSLALAALLPLPSQATSQPTTAPQLGRRPAIAATATAL